MKTKLMIVWLFYSLHLFAPNFCDEKITFKSPPEWLIELNELKTEWNRIVSELKYEPLVQAVTWYESGWGKHVYNAKENAVGWFQIRQCRVTHYNQLKGTHYRLIDFYDYALSREMFLFFAQGKSFERAARSWNGSGPMTLIYWAKVKAKLKIIEMNVKLTTANAYSLMHKGILALARAEQQGLRVDLPYVEGKKKELTKKIAVLENEFQNTNFYRHWAHSTRGPVNINSNAQLSHFLYKIKKYEPPKTTDSGQGSTDDESLKQLNVPELNQLLQMRKLKKLHNTYLDVFSREQVNGYIHPFFNLHLVRTFRSSSDHPNFQNTPIRDEESMQICRRALYPRPGHQLMEIDYSGLEVRIAACYHKDPTMLNYINDPTSDMHRDMAQQIFLIDKIDKTLQGHYNLRQAAKNGFVFPEFYGDYFKNCAVGIACEWGKLPQGQWKRGQGIDLPNGTLSDHLISKGIRELGEIYKDANGYTVITGFMKHVKNIEEDFWNVRFPVYQSWKDKWYVKYQKRGYLDTLTGFRCSGLMSKNDVINYPVQGSAFHCELWSFIKLDEFIYTLKKLDTRLVGQIHDSIILDVNPEEMNLVVRSARKIMCRDLPKAWPWIIVPLDVNIAVAPIDGSWAEKGKLTV